MRFSRPFFGSEINKFGKKVIVGGRLDDYYDKFEYDD